MKPEKHSAAPALRLDEVNQCLWRGQQNVALTPKAFLVLRYLMEHPGQLVTKEELLNAAWPEVYVGDAALKVCIRRLRQTLGDAANAPCYIETIPWRGYRFVGSIDSAESPTVQSLQSNPLGVTFHVPRSTSHTEAAKPKVSSPKMALQTIIRNPQLERLIGRKSELAYMNKLLEIIFAGEHHTLFLTGELGIGKTTLVETFLSQIASDSRYRVLSGQCIEHYGAGEPYLSLLVALEQLCRLPEQEAVLSSLRQHAPMWLLQMPSLISAVERKHLQRLVHGTTQERMMREFAAMLTHLTEEKPLILVIEDLHWSDTATIDLLAFLTQQPASSRLFFIGTYRPEHITDSTLPLARLVGQLSTHRLCHTLALEFLDETAVQAYVASRFPACSFMPALAHAVHQRTDGNPLFMVNMVEYLVAQGFLQQKHGQWELRLELADVQTLIPTNVQQLIEMQIERLLPDDQHLLEIASVAGITFTAAAAAAALDVPISAVEDRYSKLARQFHFLRTLGASEWPDGTVAQQYRFIHSLYQNVFYQRIPAGTRVQLHRQIAQQEEQAHGEQAPQIAVELAVHFERGRDFQRAVHYRRHAAETALQRHAYREATEHLTIGLELLKRLPSSDDRIQQEIALSCALGTALTATKGYASVAVERTYSRAQALWQQTGKSAPPFPILLGLWGFAAARAEIQTAATIAHQLLDTAQAEQDPLWLSLAHNALGTTSFWQGNLLAAQQHYEHSLALNDPMHLASADFIDTPGVIAASSLSLICGYLGDFPQAQAYAHKALILAEEHQQPYSLALAQCHVAALHQVRRDFSATQEIATAGIAFSSEKGFPYCAAGSTIQYGWARAMQTAGREGIEEIHQGIADYQATGATLWQTYFLALLAEAQLVAGQTAKCLQTLTEGLTLAKARRQLIPQARLYRIKGELALQIGVGDWKPESQIASPHTQSLKSLTPIKMVEEAETHFHKANEIARAQHAKAIELRATLGLSRLWRQQGKTALVRQTLAPLYQQFDNSQEIADLREARKILTAD